MNEMFLFVGFAVFCFLVAAGAGFELPFGDYFYFDEGYVKIYTFSDDSICPCSGRIMLFSEECNIEMDRLYTKGYDEVRFCGGKKE